MYLVNKDYQKVFVPETTFDDIASF